MIFGIVIFLLFGLIILFGAHFFLYFSIVRFFSITNQTAKNSILAVIIFLAVSFFLSSAIAHWRDNFLTRAYYFFSAAWLGVFVNLILAVVLGWILIWLAGISGVNLNKAALGAILFFLALVYSGYGIWNAFHPRVKNIEIDIPGLPIQWKDKKIVQISDVHLGHINRADFLAGVVNQINKQKPDLVVITGDLFDGMDGDLSSLIGPLADLNPPSGVYFVTGNHETYLGVQKVFSVLDKTKVKILNDQKQDVNGIELIGVGYPERGQSKDLGAILQKLGVPGDGKINILLYHTPAGFEEARQNGISLQLSGHTHKGQIFPFNFITYFVYRGHDYGLFHEGNYYLYTTNGTGTWGPPMRTGNVPEIVAITLK